MTGTVPVMAEWAVWAAAQPGVPPRLLARSGIPSGADDSPGADDLASLLALCPAGAQEVAISGTANQDQDYVDVVLRNGPGADEDSEAPALRTVTTCFRIPYRQIAMGPVSYSALYAGLRALAPSRQDGYPAEVLLDPIGPDGASALEESLPGSGNDFRMHVAALLLTGRPVCLLGAGSVPTDRRLHFLDAVTALLPYGMRSRLMVTTWAGDGPHGFRLYFGGAAGSAEAHVLQWDALAMPRLEDRDALGYLDWLRRTPRPADTLASRTGQLGFGQMDIQTLLTELGIAPDGQPRQPARLAQTAYRSRGPAGGGPLGPAAFMSYAHFDDKHDGGQLSKFREELSNAVKFHTARDFQIFQDRTGALWGDNWRTRINDALDGATLLLPIVTPNFFASRHCREEVDRFRAREQQLGRQDLIFPVYYATCQDMAPSQDESSLDDLAVLLRSRQHADWRDLRLEDSDSSIVRSAVDSLAQRIRDVLLDRGSPAGADNVVPASPAWTNRPAPAVQIVRPTRSGPSAFVVDQSGQGDFQSISAAMRAAKPGDLIRIQPGLYDESLHMDKVLDIVGDGPRDQVIVQAFGQDVLRFTAQAGRVSRLTLRQIGGGSRWNSVFIQRGRLELDDCDISCQSLSGIDISGGADPVITGNVIRDCHQAGILVHDSGRGTLQDNDVYGNAHAGIEIRTNGSPALTRNRIHGCGHAGVLIHRSGRGQIEENEIYDMPAYGITIRSGGNPTLLRNTIRHCALNGVFIYEQGGGLVKDNKIHDTGYSTVAIREGASPTLRGNLIHDAREAGILVSNGGLGLIEDNDIFDNGMAGVRIRTDGNPTVRRNRIFHNAGLPIDRSQGGRGTFEDNELDGLNQDAAAKGGVRRNWSPWTYRRGRGDGAAG